MTQQDVNYEEIFSKAAVNSQPQNMQLTKHSVKSFNGGANMQEA